MPFDFSIDPVSSSISQSMTMMTFGTRNFNLSEPIEMQDIIDLSAIPDGTPLPIDSLEVDPDTVYVSFPMDRQHFSSGDLQVTINNDLECELGAPVVMTFYDSLSSEPITSDGGDTVKLIWDTPITQGSSPSESISLAGVELPKHVMIITTAFVQLWFRQA